MDVTIVCPDCHKTHVFKISALKLTAKKSDTDAFNVTPFTLEDSIQTFFPCFYTITGDNDDVITKDAVYAQYVESEGKFTMRLANKVHFSRKVLKLFPRIKTARKYINGKQVYVYKGIKPVC